MKGLVPEKCLHKTASAIVLMADFAHDKKHLIDMLRRLKHYI